MRLFAASHHGAAVHRQAAVFEALGFELDHPDASFKPRLKGYQPDPGLPGRLVSWDTFCATRYDVLVIECFEQIATYLANLRPQHPGAALVWYAGNNNVVRAYPTDRVKNLIAADVQSYYSTRAPNKVRFYPPVLTDPRIPAAPPPAPPQLSLCSLVNHHERFWPQAWALALRLREQLNPIPVNLYGEGAPLGPRSPHEALPAHSALLHAKPKDGFGFAVAEALCYGRPVVMPYAWTRNKTMADYLIDGKTAILFFHEDEAVQRVRALYDDPGWGTRCRAKAQEFFNLERAVGALRPFFENLH